MIILIFDTIIRAIKNIFALKSRSILTITGIAIGALCVTLISAIGDIGLGVITTEINSFGLGSILISSDIEDFPQANLYLDELNTIEELDFVSDATPVNTSIGTLEMRGMYANSAVWGVDNGAEQAISLKLIYGRLISLNDLINSKNVCVVDKGVALAFYKRENIVGKNIMITIEGVTKNMEVIGVVSSGGILMQNLVKSVVPNMVYIPYTTLSDITGEESFNQIAVSFDESINIDNASEQILNNLSKLNETSGYEVSNIEDQKSNLESILSSVTTILSSIGAVSLFVSGICIMTVMLITVKERRTEIGVKKAVGATNYLIFSEFLIESLCLSVIGVLIGSGIALMFVFVITNLIGISFSIDILKNIFIVFSSILVGAVFGVYPAVKAASLDPIEAVKFE